MTDAPRSNRRRTRADQETTRPVARFEIHHTALLGHDGAALGALPELARDHARLGRLYEAMVRLRALDERAIALQRTGRLGTYPSSLGQEAVATAIGEVMRREDVLLPTYRETGTQMMRGVTMREILLYWGGDERGMDFSGPAHDFPNCVPIATHAPHAAGVAYALKLRREPRVAVCVLGDGATSKGDFYEAANLAGVWRLPLLFVVVNNQWAISVPRHAQSGAQTLAQKAIAAGIEAEQVDGNDLIALIARLGAGMERARGGEPYLIEALTYRFGDHTTADDASRYRSDEEVEAQWAGEPIERMRRYLVREGAWSEEREEALWSRCKAEVEAEVEAYLDTPAPPASAMFDHLYNELPKALARQRAEAMRRAGEEEEGADEDG